MTPSSRPDHCDPNHDPLAALDAGIERDGWALISREEHQRTRPALSCTLGLTLTFDHAELIVVGCEIDLAEAVVTSLAELVSKGARLSHWSAPRLEGVRFSLAEVHPRHLGELMAPWSTYLQRRGHPGPIRALQVILPERYFCPCHAQVRYWLDDPRPLVPRPRSKGSHGRKRRAS